ncbi:DNA recombination protein RmuC [bacterium]|nr:DNA recombination protein RmuC [bacterium]
MDIIISILALIILILLIVVITIVSHKGKRDDSQKIILDTAKEIQQGAQKISEQVSQRLDNLNRQLGAINKVGDQIEQFQKFLLAPKTRGNIGETFLEDMLVKVLPRDMFSLQNTHLATGIRPDAIIETAQGKIPIDSKFPIVNYRKFIDAQSDDERKIAIKDFRRDIRNHIQAVSKYILPQSGTVNFAIMYIPAESIFAHILENEQGIIHEAQNKKVIIASPNSFYYFLQLTLIAMRQQIAGKKAKKIVAGLEGIAITANKLEESAEKTQKQIYNAQKNSDNTKNLCSDLISKINKLGEMEE